MLVPVEPMRKHLLFVPSSRRTDSLLLEVKQPGALLSEYLASGQTLSTGTRPFVISSGLGVKSYDLPPQS